MKHMEFIVKEGINNLLASFSNSLPYHGSESLYFLKAFAKLPLTQHRAWKSSSVIFGGCFCLLSSLLLLPCSLILLTLSLPSSVFLVSFPLLSPVCPPDQSAFHMTVMFLGQAERTRHRYHKVGENMVWLCVLVPERREGIRKVFTHFLSLL